MTDQRVLLAALLWLRNHYDVGPIHRDLKTKKEVLARIDLLILDNGCDITSDDLRRFRLAYPQPQVDHTE